MFWLRRLFGLTRRVQCWRIKTPYSTLTGEGDPIPWMLVRQLEAGGIEVTVHTWEEER